ncbi:MAG: DUF3579 domain-containing protein [Proteobacteria bacterium]|nr:DUF3579 domain-containing protein [Pseudomonadota bacterium]
MTEKKRKIIIEGVTDTGEKFRPSDWAERMSGQLSTFHKHRIRYSPMLQPTMKEGLQCVVLDPTLKETNPLLYQSILEFAKANHLKICKENGQADNNEPAD